MFDTNIVVVGNVLTAPEWRRTASTNTLVTNFRVASTSRRMDRESGRWVDGNHLRVRVNCWRKLAEGVAASLAVGDPVVVTGRLYTRDWTDADGNTRTTYEMEAVSVGHDLARGRGRFFRNRQTATTSAVDSPEAAGQVRGEPAALVPEAEAPTVYGDGVLDGDEPTFEEVPAASPDGFDPVASLRGGGLEPFDTRMTMPSTVTAPDQEDSPDEEDPESSSDDSSEGPPSDPPGGPSSGSGDAEPRLETSVEAVEGGSGTGTRRARSRAGRRQPVPA